MRVAMQCQARGRNLGLAALSLLSMICEAADAKEISTDDHKCMRYSWLGKDPQVFLNVSTPTPFPTSGIIYKRCDEFPRGLQPIPCINPFIITQGNTVPNATKLFEEFGREVVCVPQEGETCAVVTFHYYNNVANVTAYCTRVTVDETKPLQRGCETAKLGAYIESVCVHQPSRTPWENIDSGAGATQTNMLFLMLATAYSALIHCNPKYNYFV